MDQDLAPGCKHLTNHDVEVIRYRQQVRREMGLDVPARSPINRWFGALVGIAGGLIVLALMFAK